MQIGSGGDPIVYLSASQGRGRAPWAVQIEGRQYVIPSDAPERAFELLRAYLPQARVATEPLEGGRAPSGGPNDLGSAVERGDLAEIKRLLAAGADPFAVNSVGEDALAVAVRKGGQPSLALLIDAAKRSGAVRGQYRRAMTIAVENGRLEAVRVLLAAGADPERGDDETGRTPLHMAAATGHVEVLTLLIASGARLDGGDHHETPPLVDAAEGGRVDAIRALVKHGARAKLDDALGMACDQGHAGAARALIEAGADPNGRGHWGATPLIYAARSTRRSLDVLKLLLDSGAEVDAVDDSGETALFQAAWSSWNYGPQWPQTVAAATPVIQMLLAAGADPAIKNNKGLSVLDRLAAQPEPGAAGMLAVIKEGVERRAVKKP